MNLKSSQLKLKKSNVLKASGNFKNNNKCKFDNKHPYLGYLNRETAHRKLNYAAYHDLLTGLYNRDYFNQKLEYRLKNHEESKASMSVFFIGVDNMNFINDIFGYKCGDKILKDIGKKIKGCLQREDIICRYSGDEFLILKDNNKKEIKEVVNQILEKIQEPFKYNANNVNVTISIGIYKCTKNVKTIEEILKYANIALNKAKESGKNGFRIFDEEIYSDFVKKYTIQLGLKRALENKEFVLYYQPQVNSKTNEVFGVEALVRWKHPKHGIIMPNEFIGILEQQGYIVEFGEWIIKEACHQIRKWQDDGYKNISVAVNVSEGQLKDISFLNIVKNALKETGVEAKYLKIELTERAMVKSIEKSIYIFTELRKMGIKVALDDFGTGYSSLNYLRQLPIDIIKIDKCFIDNIVFGYYENTIADVIMKLATKMGMDVVAEGVEKKDQLDVLKEKKCYNIQGYLFGRPVPPKGIEEMLSRTTKKVVSS